MPSRLAIYNFNNFRVPADEPANQGFHERNGPNFAAAALSEGFVARSGYEGEDGPPSWGPQVYPRFHVETGDGWAPSSLSLWTDLESLLAFTYGGIHAEALRNARLWFDRQRWPPYVLWWTAGDAVPDWAEGVARLERLHDRGVSPEAFDFKHPFGPDGRPATIDREAVKARASARKPDRGFRKA